MTGHFNFQIVAETFGDKENTKWIYWKGGLNEKANENGRMCNFIMFNMQFPLEINQLFSNKILTMSDFRQTDNLRPPTIQEYIKLSQELKKAKIKFNKKKNQYKLLK